MSFSLSIYISVCNRIFYFFCVVSFVHWTKPNRTIVYQNTINSTNKIITRKLDRITNYFKTKTETFRLREPHFREVMIHAFVNWSLNIQNTYSNRYINKTFLTKPSFQCIANSIEHFLSKFLVHFFFISNWYYECSLFCLNASASISFS